MSQYIWTQLHVLMNSGCFVHLALLTSHRIPKSHHHFCLNQLHTSGRFFRSVNSTRTWRHSHTSERPFDLLYPALMCFIFSLFHPVHFLLLLFLRTLRGCLKFMDTLERPTVKGPACGNFRRCPDSNQLHTEMDCMEPEDGK